MLSENRHSDSREENRKWGNGSKAHSQDYNIEVNHIFRKIKLKQINNFLTCWIWWMWSLIIVWKLLVLIHVNSVDHHHKLLCFLAISCSSIGRYRSVVRKNSSSGVHGAWKKKFDISTYDGKINPQPWSRRCEQVFEVDKVLLNQALFTLCILPLKLNWGIIT